MKTSIFSLILACFLFTACSDSDGLIPAVNDLAPAAGEEPELVPVTFNVGFSKEVSSLRSSSSDDFMIKYLDYYVFSDGGDPFIGNTITIDPSGSFEAELPVGSYTCAFIGHNGENVNIVKEEDEEYRPIKGYYDYQLQVLEEDGHVADQFYQKLHCEIRKDQANNVEVILDRNVGKVEIVLDEVIPDNVTDITLSVSFYFNKYYISPHKRNVENDKGGQWYPINGPRLGDVYKRTIPVPDEYKSKKGFTISFLSYEHGLETGTGPEGTVTLQSSNGIKYILVVVKRNKTMRYTGKLFEVADTPVPFTLTMEDDWEAPNDITF
jgi:predicted small secreted protein